MDKCKRCRFKSDCLDTCSNVASEYSAHNVEEIPEHNCSHFFSNDDTENVDNTDVMTGFMLYDYKADDVRK